MKLMTKTDLCLQGQIGVNGVAAHLGLAADPETDGARLPHNDIPAPSALVSPETLLKMKKAGTRGWQRGLAAYFSIRLLSLLCRLVTWRAGQFSRTFGISPNTTYF
jgi:hypothetical protein